MTVSKQYGVKEEAQPSRFVGGGVIFALPLSILFFTLLLGLLIWGNIVIWGAIF